MNVRWRTAPMIACVHVAVVRLAEQLRASLRSWRSGRASMSVLSMGRRSSNKRQRRAHRSAIAHAGVPGGESMMETWHASYLSQQRRSRLALALSSVLALGGVAPVTATPGAHELPRSLLRPRALE